MNIDYQQKIPNNVDLASDKTLQRALEHWQGLLGQRGILLAPAPQVQLSELRSAFIKYRGHVDQALHGLPRLLESARKIRPLVLHLSDLKLTVEVSYRRGWKVLPADAPCHVSLASSDALFLFKNEYGYDTTQVNGRFRVSRQTALGVFSRFFLPQRMVKQGYDRKHPLVLARYLAASAILKSA